MQVAQSGYYVITNSDRTKYLNHQTNKMEPITDIDTLIARSYEFLLYTKDGLELVIDRIRDIPRFNYLLHDGLLVMRIVISAEFNVITGVKE